MEPVEEISWESLFQDLEIAGDFSFALESCWNNTADTLNAAENGTVIISNNNPSSSESVFMLQDKASNFDDPSKGYLQSQTNVKERDRPDHLLAERIRRGKISQHFIALSALIPGLKRADKLSVLEGAIKQVKQLQEQVKTLEQQQTKKKRTGESVVFVKKSQWIPTNTTSFNNNSSSDIENLYSPTSKWDGTVAEADVEARVSEKNVLIRVQCEKQKGIMVKTVKEIEKLHLSVVNSSVIPFGRSILDINIIAEMEDEFNMSGEELARNLRVALLQ